MNQDDLQALSGRLFFRRLAAVRGLAKAAQHPSVQRYLKAEAICEEHGLAEDWKIFTTLFEKGGEAYNWPDAALFFIHHQSAALNLRFDLVQDRAAILLYIEARDAAKKVETEKAVVDRELRAIHKQQLNRI